MFHTPCSARRLTPTALAVLLVCASHGGAASAQSAAPARVPTSPPVAAVGPTTSTTGTTNTTDPTDPTGTTVAQARTVRPESRLPTVTVQGNYINSVGTSDAASQGVVTSKLIESRPTLRPAEVLEFVPGVIVSQHSGDGKANQYYLRGFNLDHGTDFATFVDGMPVNMPSHAHGQGYSDLNWLIPELVDRIRYRKGPYAAEEGDFASAGAARIDLFDQLPRGIASLTVGQDRYARALIANSNAWMNGNLLYALEVAHNDGPWDNPEKFHRTNGVLRYSVGNPDDRSSITAMGYSAGWNSTDQIPQRAVDAGLIGRFGALDPSDGGQTERFSLSLASEHRLRDGAWRVNAYAIRSRLDLYSDFTYLLEHPVDLDPAEIGGDQFHQAERRMVYGGGASRAWNGKLDGHDMVNTVGLQVRQDRLDPVGLYSTVNRRYESTTQQSRVRETSVALYGENQFEWTRWLRSVAGLRGDHIDFDVTSSIAQNTGRKNAGQLSPKLALIFGPWARTELFANYGQGFHSNDARGVTETVKPKEFAADPSDPNAAAEPSPGLVRSKGSELGLRTEVVPGLQSSLALWQLKLGSELVFSGDAGDTEASRPSHRSGVEFNNHYVATPWLLFDADVAFSRARFTVDDPDTPGRHIPGSVDKVVSVGATVLDRGPWFGHFQLRYFGPRPLIEDDSQRSKSTTLAYLRVGYKLTPSVKLALDVFNLFDRKASDIDYFYASRLKGEPASGVDDIHFHPVEPRRMRLTLTANF